MKRLCLEEILQSIDGRIYNGKKTSIINAVANSFQKDVNSNTLYFLFNSRGLNRRGISGKDAIVVTETPAYFSRTKNHQLTVIGVKNINDAYWNFIRYYRSLFNIPVIGVTGTCGKTTTTEMIKTILSVKYKTQSTYDGLNGLSYNLQYLLGIDESIEAAVFELGVSQPGCITESCTYFQPQVGVLLNIGVYHLQGCGTMDNYIKAKAEILNGMGNRGKLIINIDDENIKKIDYSLFKGDIITIGLEAKGQFWADNINYAGEGMAFTLYHRNKSYSGYIPGYGKHNVYNAMAAVAAAHAIGISIEEAIDSLAAFKQMRKHLQFANGFNGCSIIDDTWNCTPDSIAAALEVLRDMGKEKKKIAVIGYMPRLGANGKDEYLKIGERVVKAGIDLLIVIGKEAEAIGKRAAEAGIEKKYIYYCNTGYEVFSALSTTVDINTLVLFKFPYKCRLSKIPSFRYLMKKMILS